jgi:hypothetical protein
MLGCGGVDAGVDSPAMRKQDTQDWPGCWIIRRSPDFTRACPGSRQPAGVAPGPRIIFNFEIFSYPVFPGNCQIRLKLQYLNSLPVLPPPSVYRERPPGERAKDALCCGYHLILTGTKIRSGRMRLHPSQNLGPIHEPGLIRPLEVVSLFSGYGCPTGPAPTGMACFRQCALSLG